MRVRMGQTAIERYKSMSSGVTRGCLGLAHAARARSPEREHLRRRPLSRARRSTVVRGRIGWMRFAMNSSIAQVMVPLRMKPFTSFKGTDHPLYWICVISCLGRARSFPLRSYSSRRPCAFATSKMCGNRRSLCATSSIRSTLEGAACARISAMTSSKAAEGSARRPRRSSSATLDSTSVQHSSGVYKL